ncbi:hypothetical protein L226DRAFT_262213 [Lentinus tigrinus ALCF2SS1-7]|uniref:uncharacterized protein n=1 Tax=Lentinus tigrinus ALCF2SS1-7 TaxID=1328758 RepID=UPI00116623BD|nr:hypothetical protein L226DRAFT_262213 [Lentinus tigrinus ALCF2SS1-7]
MDAAVPTSSIQTAEKAAEAVMSGLFISVFVAGILYGMTTLQTFLYWQAYPRDGTFLKSIVAFIWVLETLHTALCIRFLYAYLILGFGDIFNFLRVDWAVGLSVLTSVIVGACVQGYYIWRVWIVSGGSILWTSIIGVFAIARTGFAIGSTALCYIYPNWLKLRDYGPALATVSGGLGSAALVDLLVALTLTFYLKRGTNLWEGSYYHKQSTNMVNQILLYTVNTGAITSATSVVCVILFAANKVTLTFLGFAAIQTKLYANSFLGSLNARAHLRKTLLDNSGMFSSGSRGVHLSIPGRGHQGDHRVWCP